MGSIIFSLGDIQLLQSLESVSRVKPRDDIERYQYYNLDNETTVATARGMIKSY